MKIRNGFVSNSSSSSFIVAVEPNSRPLQLKIDIEDECEVIKTLEELSKSRHFKYYDDDDKFESKEYQECVKQLNAGKVLKLFRASNEDYSILSGFYGHTLTEKDIVGKATIIMDGTNPTNFSRGRVSKTKVGVDIEVVEDKVKSILHKKLKCKRHMNYNNSEEAVFIPNRNISFTYGYGF